LPGSKTKTIWIELDFQNGIGSCRFDQEFIEIGKRITALLSSPKAQKHDFALAILDDFLGALYAFILALHSEPSFKYRPRGQRIDPRVVLKLARSISKAHRIRVSGKWMAGLHFNSGLFRLLAVYHRTLKIVTGQPKSRKDLGNEKDPNALLSQAKRVYKGWTANDWSNININRVQTEVNELKHKAAGIYWGRYVKESEAVSAIGELLNLLEAWETQP